MPAKNSMPAKKMSPALAIFITPWIYEEIEQFIINASSMEDVRLAVVTARAASSLERSTKKMLIGFYRIPDVTDVAVLTRVVEKIINAHGPVRSLVVQAEELQMPVASVRKHLNIEGMKPAVAENFHDKLRMKEVLRKHGLPVAKFSLVPTVEAVRRFSTRVGYPIILKPRAGARAVNTFRINHDREISNALNRIKSRGCAIALAEEFIDGKEYSCDAICMNGKMVWSSITQYTPTPLAANLDLSIQWRALIAREIDDIQFQDVRSKVAKALSVLGMSSGYAHFEWFRTCDGRLVLSEVAARTPGAKIDCMLNAAHGFDFGATWFRLMTFGECDLPPPRKFSAGVVFLRAKQRGKIRAVYGLHKLVKELGNMCFEKEIPDVGDRATLDYEGNGSIVVRHRSTKIVHRWLTEISNRVRIKVAQPGRSK